LLRSVARLPREFLLWSVMRLPREPFEPRCESCDEACVVAELRADARADARCASAASAREVRALSPPTKELRRVRMRCEKEGLDANDCSGPDTSSSPRSAPRTKLLKSRLASAPCPLLAPAPLRLPCALYDGSSPSVRATAALLRSHGSGATAGPPLCCSGDGAGSLAPSPAPGSRPAACARSARLARSSSRHAL